MASGASIGPTVRFAWLARLYGTALAWYLRLVAATSVVHGRVSRDQTVLAFWHEFNLAVIVVALKRRRDLPHASFSTRGFRGLVISTALGSLGVQVLPLPDEGANRAEARDLALGLGRLAADGFSLVVTPDGPFGPHRIAKPGALIVARAAGIPILPWAVRARPALRFSRRWDRHLLPLPFSRIRVVEGRALRLAAREPLHGRLVELQAELDTVAGSPSVPSTPSADRLPLARPPEADRALRPVTKIRFGTDGWRAAIAEDFTFRNVRRCARGVAEYLHDTRAANRGVVVCHDRRFASEYFARACVEVLAAHDIRAYAPPDAVPTQVGSFFTHELGAGAGIVITASHNPWTDNGFKVKADTGGAAPPEMLAAIEATMDRHAEDEPPPRRDYDDAVAAGMVETFDPYPRFRDQLASIVDIDRIRAADRRVLVEPMWGSGAGWFSRLLGDGRLTVRELHTERNPYFGGVNPEPIRPNIDAWLEEIPRWGADIGIAFDGDADRVGMATEEGVFVNQLQVYGLLYWYLLDVRGQIGPAVYTVTTTSMAKRLAEVYGTQAYETGVGFKFVGPKMIETNAVIGGEESGGFGFGMHIPERDGLASGLFLLDLWLSKGAQASDVLAELQAIAGPSYYNRIDIRFPREGYERVKADTLAQLADEAPEVLAGRPVVERRALETGDGFKFYRDDGSWLLIRFSGTEALLRVYTEARSPEDVEALLAEGRRIAGSRAPGRKPQAGAVAAT